MGTLTGKPGKPSVPFPGGPSSPWGSRPRPVTVGATQAWDVSRWRGHRSGTFGFLVSLEGVSQPKLPRGSPAHPCRTLERADLWAGKAPTCSVTAVSTDTEGTVTCRGCSLSSDCDRNPQLDPMSSELGPGLPRVSGDQVSASPGPCALGPVTHPFAHQSGVSRGSYRPSGTSGTLRRRGVGLGRVSGT